MRCRPGGGRVVLAVAPGAPTRVRWVTLPAASMSLLTPPIVEIGASVPCAPAARRPVPSAATDHAVRPQQGTRSATAGATGDNDLDPDRLSWFASVRSGPDALPPTAFTGAPWVVRWTAYWYRSHVRCGDGSCRCRRGPLLFGDGFCVIAYADGTYDGYDLSHGPAESPLAWAVIAASGRVRCPTVAEALDRAVPAPMGRPSAHMPDVRVEGVRAAVQHAIRLGWVEVTADLT